MSAELSDTVAHNPPSPTSSSSRDARARKSGAALRRALLALLDRKPFEQITVREIAAEAGVHYATFFRHHPTREALLDSIAAEQIERLVALTVPVLDRADGRAATAALLDYVGEHRLLWTALLGGAAGAMREALQRISGELARERRPGEGWPPRELVVNYSVGLIFETLAWWLAQEPGPADPRLAPTLATLLAAVQSIAEAGNPPADAPHRA